MMKARLVMTSNGREQTFPLDRPRTLIGRAMRCDVRVPLLTVAHEHCEITVTEQGLEIVDLGSEGGTTLNGHTVERASVVPNDTVGIGPVSFRVTVETLHEDAPGILAEPKPHARHEPSAVEPRASQSSSSQRHLR